MPKKKSNHDAAPAADMQAAEETLNPDLEPDSAGRDASPATEKTSERDAEAMEFHQDEASQDEINIDEQAEEGLNAEIGADADETMPAEVGAIHADNETARAMNEPASKLEKKKAKKADRAAAKKDKPAKPAKKVANSRSKNYLKAKEQVETGKVYALAEALELAKQTSIAKFDASIEIHLRTTKKKGKGNTESTRGIVTLPHGSGKDKKIVVLDEAKIEEIAKTKKIDFDVAVASPALMPKVAKIARILGPKGKMPDPKSGTVTDTPDDVVKAMNSGRIEYRIDDTGNIHQMIGRVSWDTDKLLDNAKVMLGIMPKSRLASVAITATIGPAIRIDLTGLK